MNIADPDTVTLLFLNNTENTYVLMIENDDSNGIYIESVFVNDESGYQYILDTFCLNDNETAIGRDTDLGQLCTDFDISLNEYDAICIDSNNCGDRSRICLSIFNNI